MYVCMNVCIYLCFTKSVVIQSTEANDATCKYHAAATVAIRNTYYKNATIHKTRKLIFS